MLSKKDLLEFKNLLYDLQIGELGDDNKLAFYPHLSDRQKNNFLEYFEKNNLVHAKTSGNKVIIPDKTIENVDFHKCAISYLSKQYKEWENNFDSIFPGVQRHGVNTKFGTLGCVFHSNITQKRAAESAKKDILSESGLSHNAVFRFRPKSKVVGRFTEMVTDDSLMSQKILINANQKVEVSDQVRSQTFLDIIEDFLKSLVKIMSLGMITFNDNSKVRYQKLSIGDDISQLVVDPSYLTIDPAMFQQSYIEQSNQLRNTGIDKAVRKKDFRKVERDATLPITNSVLPRIVFKEPGISSSAVAQILNQTQKSINDIHQKLDINLEPVKSILYRNNATIRFTSSETLVEGRKEMLNSKPRAFCSGATLHRNNGIIIPGFQDPTFLSAVLLHEAGHVVSHSMRSNKLETLGNKAKAELGKYMKKHNIEIDAEAMTASGKAYRNPDYHKGKDWFSTFIGILPALVENDQFCKDYKKSAELSNVKEFADSMTNAISKNKSSHMHSR